MGGGPDERPERYAIADPIAHVPLADARAARPRHRRRDGLGAPQPQLRAGGARAGGDVELVEIAGAAGAPPRPRRPGQRELGRGHALARAARRAERRAPRGASAPATHAALRRATSSSGPSSPPALLTSGLAGVAIMRSAGERDAQRLRRRRVELGREPGELALGPGEDHRHAVVDRARRRALAAVVRIVADSIGSPSSVPGRPQAGEGERRAVGEREAERDARLACDPRSAATRRSRRRAAARGGRRSASRPPVGGASDRPSRRGR